MVREPAHGEVFATGRRHVVIGAALSVAYVALVGARRTAHFGLGDLALCAGAIGLAWMSARVRVKLLAWATWGAAIVVATLIESSPATRAAAAIGTVVATAAGMIALTRIASLGGIVRDRKRSPRIGLVLLGAVWAPAAIAIATSFSDTYGTAVAFASLLTAGAATTSAIALVALGAAALLERRLELGVAERLSAFLLASAGLGGLAIALAAIGAVPIAGAACALATFASAALAALSDLGDPVALWRGVRRATALAGLAFVLTALFAFLLVDQRAHERGLLAVLVLGALLAGAELPRIARALRGDASRRLASLATARGALKGRDADSALASALQALRAVAPPRLSAAATPAGNAYAELWTLDPVRILRVDAAGYAHDERGELPPELVVVACAEPESTLRAEALVHVEVRRPDLRALSRWMSDAKFSSATLIARGGDIEAVLFLPTYDSIPDLTLEEARALRDLADELAPLCHARAKLARSMVREHEARAAESEATTRAERLEHHLARAAAHHALAATRLARPAAVGIYSARSRSAYEALERLAKTQAPIAVVARIGVDPVPFLARAHLAGARRSAPFVLVDCTSTREHDLERWRDPVASPLALADGGVLVLLDAAALPLDLQRLVGQSLAERRAPWERGDSLDIVLALTTVEEPRALAEAGRLDTLLASRAGSAIDDPVYLPGIAERPEDIRALVTDRLAREGLRVRGAPVGIDDGAFAILVDHPFDAEDAELASLVHKLVARTESRGDDVVREADVRAVLGAEPPEQLVAAAPAVISPKTSRRGT